MIEFDLLFCGGYVVIGGLIVSIDPSIPRAVDDHVTALTDRFKHKRNGDELTVDSDPATGDRAVSYVDRIVDRQINKIRGVMSLDALMLTFLGLLSRNGSTIDVSARHLWPVLLLMATLIGASAMCLFLFRVHWGNVADYTTFSSEIKATLELARKRSFWVERTVRLSIVALGGIVVLVAATVAGR